MTTQTHTRATLPDKRKYGDHEGCTRCQQDIEWWGRAKGWVDRGGNRLCPPYKARNGEIVTPKGKRHTIRES